MKFKLGLLGAVGTAFLASACCLGPLVLAGLGAGAVGLAAGLERYRWIFAALTLGILGGAFYLVYRPEIGCEGGSCAVGSGTRRAQKIALWVVALVAIALLAYPNIAAWRARAAAAEEPAVVTPSQQTLALRIEGMTCAGCAATVAEALRQLPGVVRASVNFDAASAVVVLDPTRVSEADLVRAVEDAGYRAIMNGAPKSRAPVGDRSTNGAERPRPRGSEAFAYAAVGRAGEASDARVSATPSCCPLPAPEPKPKPKRDRGDRSK